jgi:hypothetical protein
MKIEQPRLSRGHLAPDGYVLAASVVDTFQPERLQPVQGFERDLGKLLDLSVMSEKEGGTVEWRLPDDVRRSALQTLDRMQGLHATLDANRGAANGDSPYQVMFEQYVAGNAIPLEQQTLEQLQASLNAVRLLEGMELDLPDANQVRAALHRQGFIRQFELLADNHFVGREASLWQLRKFVDVLPEGILHTVRRYSANTISGFGLHSVLYEAPLLITGMGGMGKSALLSKFLLEHLKTSASPYLFFAYIDFDKSAIWPDQPLTVLAEIAQQLALQVPGHAAEFQQLNAQLVAELSFTTAYGGDFDSFEAFGNLGTHGLRLEVEAIRDFASICQSALKRATRETLLLVFDTFEEVSQRSAQHQQRLLQFVDQLQRILPRLRVVISGRGMHADSNDPYAVTGLVDELTKEVTPLELKELTEQESCLLLESLGAPNPRTNKAIVRRVGGHPLSLRLAAQLVGTVSQRLGRPAAELTSADLFDNEWLDHMSEGLLYRRIIAHIPDEPLQKLADPGLVLREITPEIILNVLNEPCALGLQRPDEANALFDRLKQFNQLVSIQSFNVVRHRPELRQRVLKEMQHGQPQLCQEIWARAARYYESRGEGRVEELYCRLMLDEPIQLLAQRWQPGLEKDLLRSRPEMPVRARQFLELMALVADGRSKSDDALQVDLDLDQALLAEEMKLLLSRGSAKAALDLFRATSSGKVPRFDSILYAVHVRAIAQSGDLDRAVAMAVKGLSRLEEAGKAESPRYLELLLLCCQVTQAQHAAGTHRLRDWVRQVLQPSLPLRAEELCWRFKKVDHDGSRQVLVLRIAVALLELFDIERVMRPDTNPSKSVHDNFCPDRARGAMLRLRPDYFGVDGGLLLRSMAWLSPYVESVPEVKELLGVPQAIAVLVRDYGDSLEEYLAKERTHPAQHLMEQLRSFSQDRQSSFFELDGLTDEQTRKVGAALRHVIRARDIADGSYFS